MAFKLIKEKQIVRRKKILQHISLPENCFCNQLIRVSRFTKPPIQIYLILCIRYILLFKYVICVCFRMVMCFLFCLSSSCALCTQCCQCYIILSHHCLSSSCVLCTQCCQFLWIVRFFYVL